MKIEKLLELAKENFYLEETTYLPQIPESDFRRKLTEYYNHDLEEVRLMGSILNSIYTEGKTTFHFSKRSLGKLIENDRKNLEGKGRPKISLGKEGYKINFFRQKLMEYFKENNESFEVLKEASIRFKTPSVIEFIDGDLFKDMDKSGSVTKKLKKSWKQLAIDSISEAEREIEDNIEMGNINFDEWGEDSFDKTLDQLMSGNGQAQN